MPDNSRDRKALDLLQKNLPPEFLASDATRLISRDYRAANKALEYWVHQGHLIRLKRGLYTFRSRWEPLAAANIIYQPSYVSFETALSFYGLIPEAACSVLSVTDNRSSKHTAEGVYFSYSSQVRELFAKGMTSVKLNDRRILIATPEKALLDTLASKQLVTKSLNAGDVQAFVLDSLRIDTESLMSLSQRKIATLIPYYRNKAPELLHLALKSRKGKSK